MRITKAVEHVRIEYNGVVHLAITDGSRTETKCGLIAKGLSGQTEVFKTVGIEGSIMVDCEACNAASQTMMEMTE